MPRTKYDNERIKEQSKENIIDKAIGVFAKKGFAAANIKDIAEEAGISVGLMYRYFKSKDELFAYITDFAISGLKEMTARLMTDSNPKEMIAAVAQELIDEFDNELFINLNMMMIQGLMSENNSVYNELLSYDKKMFSALADLIKRGQETGQFCAGDPMAKSCCFFAQIQGLVTMKYMLKYEFKKPCAEDLTALFFSKGEKK